jgi:hypothetical protein
MKYETVGKTHTAGFVCIALDFSQRGYLLHTSYFPVLQLENSKYILDNCMFANYKI